MKKIVYIMLLTLLCVLYINKSANAKQLESVTDEQGVTYTLGEDGYSDSPSAYYVQSFYPSQIYNSEKKLYDVVIPDRINGLPVKSILSHAFKGNDVVQSVIFGKNIEIIGCNAFENCVNLVTVIANGDVKEIQNNAFVGCKSLKKISFLSSLQSVGSSAYENCISLQDITLGKGLHKIMSNAFKNCIELTSISFPKTISMIGTSAFEGCKKLQKVSFRGMTNDFQCGTNAFLKTKWLDGYISAKKPVIIKGMLCISNGMKGKVVLKKNIKGIAGYAFSKDKKITSIKANGIKYVSTYAFNDCSAKKIELYGESRINAYAFQTSKVKEIFIKAAVKINPSAFSGAVTIKKISLGNPRNILINGSFAFRECKKLKHVYLKSKKVFKGIEGTLPEKIVLHVPTKCRKDYKKLVDCKVA